MNARKAAALLLCAGLATACSHSSSRPLVADLGSSTPPASTQAGASSGGSPYAQALSYSRCMRAHGIGDFPDPDSGGGFHVAAIRAAGVDVTTPQFHATAAACQDYQPNGIQVPGGAARS